MKLKELKAILNTLSQTQLEQELKFNSKAFSISGCVANVIKSKSNLYYTGEDDPSDLLTKKELIENGYDKEEIQEMELEIKKGELYLEL
jgi:hypothetical protein